ncbi:MAG: hypothetical protein IID41_11215 [Planctomycetes bacterium]|nr:hypothetical protein [Planctomycetota bacterium]
MAVLGLLAFTITILGGLASGNRVEFILPRALWAMGLFCFLGWVVGWCAERIVAEHRTKQREEILGPAEEPVVAEVAPDAETNSSTPVSPTPIQ